MVRCSQILLFSVFFLFLNSGANSARILCVFPIPSISHQVVFRAYTQELIKNGHELVIITPKPTLPKERPKDNITEIDVGLSHKKSINKLGIEGEKFFKRGVVINVWKVIEYGGHFLSVIHSVKEQFDHPEVKKLIEDKNQHFDLIVAESFINYPLIFSGIFKAPVIQFSSFYGNAVNYETLGAVSRHPFLYPNMFRDKFRDLSFWEKICQVYMEYRLWMYESVELENGLLKEQFGPLYTPIEELKNNVEMLFVNSHPIFDGNRPVPPNVVYLGAIHLLPVKELPKDLNMYLDNASRGVIYVSLGTNIRTSKMNKDLLNVFLDAFKALPYEILWKFDDDTLQNKSENVRIQKWYPQRDLLMHPNIKAFVTQGGLQSTDEAIDAGVPLVGIPMLGDQWYNVNKYIELGIGVHLDALTLTADKLENGIKTVIEDDSYRRNILRLRSVMHDQPQRPLERAVWWTEHVLRHGGARHLRAPAANMSWWQYLMLDLVIPFILTATALLVLAFVAGFHFIYLIKKHFCKTKSSKNKVKFS